MPDRDIEIRRAELGIFEHQKSLTIDNSADILSARAPSQRGPIVIKKRQKVL